MNNKSSQWLLGSIFFIYAFGTLVLVTGLANYPLNQDALVAMGFPPKAPEITDLEGATALPDFSAIDHTPERKQAFIDLLLPMIEHKNQYVLKNRATLLAMKQQLTDNIPLTEKQQEKLESLRKRYRVTYETYPDTNKAIEILLMRADVIPASMVIAQAAIESGWGTSRFATEAHNIFGQWCYTAGCGLVPERRPANATHEVKKFESVEASLNAYYRNINTFNAYRELRQLRARLREEQGYISGIELVSGLEKYSSRGHQYITELRSLIKMNDLEKTQLVADNTEVLSHQTHINPLKSKQLLPKNISTDSL